MLPVEISAIHPSVPALTDGLYPLLLDAKVSLSPEEVAALVEGAAAAPKGIDPDAWLDLISPDLTRAGSSVARQALAARLRAARDRIRDRRPTRPAGATAERLAAVRAACQAAGATAFMVPRNDEHQGEYVPARAERLAWLTGFTGSAGVAIVTSTRAAVFVDGRYTLQAKDEVDGPAVEIHHISESTPTDWLATALTSNDALGFDPWLHTANGVGRLEGACQRAGARLLALEPNPLDRAWLDQPPPPLAPVVPHAERFAGAGLSSKLDAIAEIIGNAKADAAFLAQPDSIAWLLNIRGGDVPFSPLPLSFALARADGTADLFIDPRKLLAETRDRLAGRVRVHHPAELGPVIDAMGKAGLALLVDPARAPSWADARAKAAGVRVVRADDPTVLPKARKNQTELDGTRAAHVRDGVALTRFLHWLADSALSEGAGELDAIRRLDRERASGTHYRGPSFPTIAGAGSNGAIVHYRATAKTERRLEAGSLFLVDSGGQYLDGTTDVTRTVAIGPPTAEMRERFTRVLKGHIAIATARFPRGTSGGQIDSMARRPLWEAGLDYDHGTGHGVGSYLGVHEGPQRIARGGDGVALEAGMIVSNEPGYYKAGAYGIRIENLVAVVPVPAPAGAERELLGFETLTLAPLDRTLIATARLSPDERAWVDGYHRRVCDTLAEFLDGDTWRWLKAATAPLDVNLSQGPLDGHTGS